MLAPEGLYDPLPPPVIWCGNRSCRMRGGEGSDEPLFLQLLRTCTPHLGWLSGELRCSPWILVKWMTQFADRVLDTAEDFQLPVAASQLVKSLSSQRQEDSRRFLHITTSPLPREGKVKPGVLLNVLGPVGSHVIPTDICKQAVPAEFYAGAEGFQC